MKTSSQSLLTNKSETENGQTNYVMTAMRRPLLAFAVGFLLGNFVVTVLTYLTGDTLARKLFVLVKNPPPLNDDGGLDITHKIVYRDSNKSPSQPLLGSSRNTPPQERCVTTLIMAAKETRQ